MFLMQYVYIIMDKIVGKEIVFVWLLSNVILCATIEFILPLLGVGYTE
jgi:hypothetical protein